MFRQEKRFEPALLQRGPERATRDSLVGQEGVHTDLHDDSNPDLQESISRPCTEVPTRGRGVGIAATEVPIRATGPEHRPVR